MESNSYLINNEKDVYDAGSMVAKLAGKFGFNKLQCAELALAVTEICQNTIRHASGGKLSFFSLSNRRGLKIIVEDKGKGISNIKQAMNKGYSTYHGSLGLGLDVAKRSVDEFQVDSTPSKGTKVTMTKFLSLVDTNTQYGVVSLPENGYSVNGDTYLLKEFGGNMLLAVVVDGLGQGYKAHSSAMLVKEHIEMNFRDSLEKLIVDIDAILKSEKDYVSVALSILLMNGNHYNYIGMGDTHVYLINNKLNKLINFNGGIGDFQLPSLKTEKGNFEIGDSFVLCTDGIKSINSIGSNAFNAQELANYLFKKNRREYGDATIVTIKYLNPI